MANVHDLLSRACAIYFKPFSLSQAAADKLEELHD